VLGCFLERPTHLATRGNFGQSNCGLIARRGSSRCLGAVRIGRGHKANRATLVPVPVKGRHQRPHAARSHERHQDVDAFGRWDLGDEPAGSSAHRGMFVSAVPQLCRAMTAQTQCSPASFTSFVSATT
jgi:hypothetical protein